jgi:hypothetical protein
MAKTTLLNYKARPRIISSPLSYLLIGLDKPEVRAKGINHPKHAVEAVCACLKRESARPLPTFID